MKKKYFLLLLAGAALLPGVTQAQSAKQYLEKAKENAALEAKITSALLRKKYQGDEAMEKGLYKILFESRIVREETAAKYAGKADLEKRLAEVIERTDSVKEVYLITAKNKGLVNNKALKLEDKSKFAAAIRIRQELSLSSVQVDSLFYHTNTLAQLMLNNPGLYPKDYERQVLPRILSDEQYTNLLVSLAKPKAIKAAQKNWQELKNRGLLPGSDSVKISDEVVKHLIGKYCYEERYDVAPTNMTASMRAIMAPEPQAIKVERTARRYNNRVKEQAAKPELRW